MNTLELVLLVVVVTVDVILGSITLIRNHRSWSNRLFALLVASLVAWLIANFACDQPAFYEHALALNRLAMGLGLVMGVMLLAFALTYPAQRVRVSWWWRGLLTVFGAFAALAVTTDALIEDVSIRAWGTNVVQGTAFPYLTVAGVAALLGMTLTLARRYRSADVLQRGQLTYLFTGLIAFSSATTVLGTVLPSLTGSNELMALSPAATLLLLIPTSYAIVRHRLMDVSFVALRSLAYALLAVSLGGVFLLFAEIGRSHLVSDLGLDPEWVLVIGGLLCVLGFQPLLGALRRLTDGFLYRRSYDPAQLLGELTKLLSSTLDPSGLASSLAAALSREMRVGLVTVIWRHEGSPRSASTGRELPDAVLYQLLDLCRTDTCVVADELEATDPRTAPLAAAGVRVLASLNLEGEQLGALVLGGKRSGSMYSTRDIAFLEILAPETAIALKNAQLYDEKAQRVRELTALNRLSAAIGANMELDAILDRALNEIVMVTKADSGSIMLLDETEQVLRIVRSIGLPAEAVARTCVPLGEGIAGWVAANKEGLILVDDTDPRFAAELVRHDIISAISTPVIAKDRVIGVLNLNRTSSPEIFTSEALHVTASFAGQLGVSIENARLYGDLESTFLGTISALAAAVDAKDPYTFGHSNEVTTYAVALAEGIGLPERDVQTIRIAATLHDIGKIGIDGAILNKPGKLTDDERTLINRHPAIGADILAPLDFLRDAVPLILFHHERFGGHGYPTGISGDAIPLGARIIAIADSFNAMVSDRPYRQGMSLDAALTELQVNAGTQFDPELVDAFTAVLANEAGDEAIERRHAAPAPAALQLPVRQVTAAWTRSASGATTTSA